jgi:alpha/beta superfamily hydrolase
VPGANHFFTDKTAELVQVIESYLDAAPSLRSPAAAKSGTR